MIINAPQQTIPGVTDQSSIILSNLLNIDKQTLNTIQETNGIDITEERVSEWIKCRQNPLYFILNYVYFQEFGGKQLYSKEYMHAKFRRTVRTVFRYHMVILMASRQLGKSTIAAGILAWALIFFHRIAPLSLIFKKWRPKKILRKLNS